MTNYQLAILIAFLGLYSDKKIHRRFGLVLIILNALVWIMEQGS